MVFILLSSKNEEIYLEVFQILKKVIIEHNNNISFDNIKIMSDFELGLRSAIKKIFVGASLQGCYFHYCKSIWKKIKKLNL